MLHSWNGALRMMCKVDFSFPTELLFSAAPSEIPWASAAFLINAFFVWPISLGKKILGRLVVPYSFYLWWWIKQIQSKLFFYKWKTKYHFLAAFIYGIKFQKETAFYQHPAKRVTPQDLREICMFSLSNIVGIKPLSQMRMIKEFHKDKHRCIYLQHPTYTGWFGMIWFVFYNPEYVKRFSGCSMFLLYCIH